MADYDAAGGLTPRADWWDWWLVALVVLAVFLLANCGLSCHLKVSGSSKPTPTESRP